MDLENYNEVYGNYKPTIKDKDGKDVVITYEKFDENHKKMISKNDESKMALYNALPKKEYEMIFMCDTNKDIWDSLMITHQARKVLSEEEAISSDSNDEEYAMAVRDFKKFFRRRGKFVRQPHDDKRNFRKAKEDKKDKDDRRCFKCGDPNHFISDCPKHSFNDQKAFVAGCWSDSEDDSKKKEICLMAFDDSEVRLKVKLDLDEWIKDIGYSKYMMGDKDLFSSYKTIDGGNVVFDGNTKSKIVKQEMLKKFSLEDSKPIKIPMASQTKLTQDEDDEPIDDTKYHSMIGSLLYLTVSLPDIMFSVFLCARFQEAPKTSHIEAVKRIFRYIKGTSHLGLWYPKGTRLETIVYSDSDHEGDYVDHKSTSGVCTFMGCCLISWFSKKQTALAISTIKAEYVSAGKAC
nr:uncharacterized mitochondrial protein AtMg00810-like [Tanacetum cinerariifolium]